MKFRLRLKEKNCENIPVNFFCFWLYKRKTLRIGCINEPTDWQWWVISLIKISSLPKLHVAHILSRKVTSISSFFSQTFSTCLLLSVTFYICNNIKYTWWWLRFYLFTGFCIYLWIIVWWFIMYLWGSLVHATEYFIIGLFFWTWHIQLCDSQVFTFLCAAGLPISASSILFVLIFMQVTLESINQLSWYTSLWKDRVPRLFSLAMSQVLQETKWSPTYIWSVPHQ